MEDCRRVSSTVYSEREWKARDKGRGPRGAQALNKIIPPFQRSLSTYCGFTGGKGVSEYCAIFVQPLTNFHIAIS